MMVEGTHVCMLEGAKEVGRQGEERGDGLECSRMSRREARGVVAMLRPSEHGLVVDGARVPLVPRHLHIITYGAEIEVGTVKDFKGRQGGVQGDGLAKGRGQACGHGEGGDEGGSIGGVTQVVGRGEAEAAELGWEAGLLQGLPKGSCAFEL